MAVTRVAWCRNPGESLRGASATLSPGPGSTFQLPQPFAQRNTSSTIPVTAMLPKHRYAQLDSGATLGHENTHAKRWRCLHLGAYLCPVVTLIGGFLFGIFLVSTTPAEFGAGGWCKSAVLSETQSAIDNVATELASLRRRPVQFSGSFNFPNRYRGPPSDELDAEWDRFTHHGKLPAGSPSRAYQLLTKVQQLLLTALRP